MVPQFGITHTILTSAYRYHYGITAACVVDGSEDVEMIEGGGLWGGCEDDFDFIGFGRTGEVVEAARRVVCDISELECVEKMPFATFDADVDTSGHG